MAYTGRKQTDNSHYFEKLTLRTKYIDLVGADTCFDLFVGIGTFTDAIYSKRFARVVCVDNSRKQLEQLSALPNIDIYQGDNANLLTGLLVKYGAPDFVDLDAYGSPDTLAKRLIQTRVTCRPMAIIGTDGGMKARQRGSMNGVPTCWGFGPGLSHAQFGAAMDAVPVRAFTFLRDWSAAAKKTVAEFDAHVCGAMCYWAALIVPEDVT
jgi:hypothetical protein